MTRIAIVIPTDTLGGAEKRAINLVLGLQDYLEAELWVSEQLFDKIKCHNPAALPYLVTYKNTRSMREKKRRAIKFISNKINLKFIEKIERKSAKKYLLKINEMISTRNIDLLHVFMDNKIYGELNCPAIHEVVGPEFALRLVNWRPEQIFTYKSFHAVSESVFDKCGDSNNFPSLVTAPIPYFSKSDGNWAKNTNKKRIITFAHRMVPRKNAALFARAAKIFLEKEKFWTVRIMGDGPDKKKVESVLREEIHHGNVQLYYKANIVDELLESMIFVSLNAIDNYPSQSVLEAMSAGNALLLSDRGSTKNKFLASNGMLCDLNAEEIADKLRLLSSDADSLIDMGQMSINLVNDRYDKHTYLSWLVTRYQSIIRTGQ